MVSAIRPAMVRSHSTIGLSATRVDVDHNAHAYAKGRLTFRCVDAHAHRNALDVGELARRLIPLRDRVDKASLGRDIRITRQVRGYPGELLVKRSHFLTCRLQVSLRLLEGDL